VALTCSLSSAMMNEPWFSGWNLRFFELVFKIIPHSPRANSFFEFFILNPLASTWIYAVTWFQYWMKQDDSTLRRRSALTRAMLALVVAVLLTLLPRPWIGWPAPNCNPLYEQMFPRHLRGTGSQNCFPSHSTLVYFIVALGFWPINRLWSAATILIVLVCISLPRVYLGGHYPVDVLFSLLLGLTVFLLTRNYSIPHAISSRIVPDAASASACSALLFLWLFELGEGFRGSELLLGLCYRWLHRLI
jgi:membrane-associated phospholipid phosphatase